MASSARPSSASSARPSALMRVLYPPRQRNNEEIAKALRALRRVVLTDGVPEDVREPSISFRVVLS
jgi:hypothetical protein